MPELFEVVASGEATLTADNRVTVDITEVIPSTERVHPRELKDDDILFDAFGGELPLAYAKHYKNHTRTKRQDGLVEYWPYDLVPTITRKKRN